MERTFNRTRQPPIPADLRRRLESLGRHAGASLAGTPPDADRGAWKRTWRFPNDESALRWNEGWDGVLEGGGAMHPALFTIEGQSISDPYLDALARVVGAILADEILAGTPCPYVEPGWGYALAIEHAASGGAGGGAPLVVKLLGAVSGDDGDLRWTTDSTRVYGDDEVPRSLVALWGTRRWAPVDEIYG